MHSTVISYVDSFSQRCFHCIVSLFFSLSSWLLFCRINTFKLPKLTSCIWWSNWRYLRTRRRSTWISLSFHSRVHFHPASSHLHTYSSNRNWSAFIRPDNMKTINFHRLRFKQFFYRSTKLQQLGIHFIKLVKWIIFYGLHFLLNYHKPFTVWGLTFYGGVI